MRPRRFILSLATLLLLVAVIGASSIPKGSIPTRGIFDDDPGQGFRITGDGGSMDPGFPSPNTVYEHNVDGVISFLSPKYLISNLDPTSWARGFQINLNSTQPRRNLRFDFSDWITSLAPVPPMEKFNEGIFAVGNLPEVGCAVLDGGCLTTALFITPSPEGIRLRFDPVSGGNKVLATRIGTNTWEVRTQPGADVAHLSIQTKGPKGQPAEKPIGTFHMPFHLVIVPK